MMRFWLLLQSCRKDVRSKSSASMNLPTTSDAVSSESPKHTSSTSNSAERFSQAVRFDCQQVQFHQQDDMLIGVDVPNDFPVMGQKNESVSYNSHQSQKSERR